jgi:hypothetical protein
MNNKIINYYESQNKPSKYNYKVNFPKCPYKVVGGEKCNNKHIGKFCSYSKPESCPYYQDWVKLKKIDKEARELDENTTGELI